MGGEDGLKTIEIQIQGMQCHRCVETVQKALEGVEGLDYVRVSLGKAEVRFQPYLLSRKYIEEVIRNSGYPVDKLNKKKRRRFIDRMIESNEKNFGHKRLDCCNLSSPTTTHHSKER